MSTTPFSNGQSVDHETMKTASAEFVDFYSLLGQPRDAGTVQLRSRLNELYAEAQANRDHRNPERRKQYARLLQWIPTARGVLLHEERRARYDEYSTQRLTSVRAQDFHIFLQNLLGQNEFIFSDGESIPAIREAAAPRLLPSLDAVRAATQQSAAQQSVVQQSVATNTTLESAANGAVASQVESKFSEAIETAIEKPAKPKHQRTALHASVLRERALLLGSALGGFTFFVLLLGLRVVLGTSSNLTLLVGVAMIGGFVVWRAASRALLAQAKAVSRNL